MKKKCLLLVLIIGMLFSYQAVFAEVDYTKEADMLNALGLFNGTQNGYELNRVPTRVEAAAMLVRLLGGVNEANEKKYEHPFTDVPEWADNIVGYMYEKGYTNGIGNNLFGSNQVTIARDYATFMLRSLGYSSSSDFNYLEALEFAATNGLITNEEAGVIKSQEFKRNEMVLLSYRTLKAPVKGENRLLAEKLVELGSIDAQKAYDAGVADFDVIPVKVYKENGRLKIDIYYSKLSPELKEFYIFSSGTNGPVNYDDINYLASSSILTNEQKQMADKDLDDFIGDSYYTDMKCFIGFYDDEYLLNFYCIIPENIGEGDHNFVIRRVTDEVKELIVKSEKGFLQYRAEKLKKISEIPARCYTIEELDGEYYIVFDTSKLPDSMKNAVFYGQGGVSDNKLEDDIERMFKDFFTNPNAYRHDDDEALVSGEPIKLRYSHTYTLFTLFDENEDVIGIMVINPQF